MKYINAMTLLLVGFSSAIAAEPSRLVAKLDSRDSQTMRRRAEHVVKEATSFMHAVAKPIREVEITSSTSGRIANVFVKEGTRVKKGEPLIAFDLRLTEARLSIAEAELQRNSSTKKSAKLELDLAGSRFKNMAAAFREGAATNVELVESQIRWQQAKARHQAAIDEQKQLQESRRYAALENELRTVVAPFDCTIVSVFAVPGQTPTLRDVLVHLVDTSKLRVDFYVPVSQFDSISDKKELRLNADPPVRKQLKAKVVVINNVIEPATQTIRCVLEIDNPDGSLPSGFRVRM